MCKNREPIQTIYPWCIPAVPTGKSEFSAPNCPVIALRYYHGYMTEHPELGKGRCSLFNIPIKDNNVGNELSAATISRWICTTIVDSHAALQKSKCIHRTLKVHEVPCSSYFFTTLQQGGSTDGDGAEDGPAEAPSCSSTSETSVHKLTAYVRQAQLCLQHDVLSRSPDLAKLNPKCHMH